MIVKESFNLDGVVTQNLNDSTLLTYQLDGAWRLRLPNGTWLKGQASDPVLGDLEAARIAATEAHERWALECWNRGTTGSLNHRPVFVVPID